jgi:hypothetical protein
MKKKFTSKLNNAIEPAVSTSVWGYKGCAGKGGKTKNSNITIAKSNTKESN